MCNLVLELRGMKVSGLSSYASFFLKPTVADSKLKHILWYAWFSLMGLIVANHGLPSLTLILKTMVLTASIAMFVYLLNDAMDAEFDKLNKVKSSRPIPSGLATKAHAMHLSILGSIVGLSLAITTNSYVLTFTLLYMMLGSMYSIPPFHLKRRPLMKETTLALGVFLATGIGALANGIITTSLFYVGIYLGIFILTLVPTFYDALDEKEDRLLGCKTIAILLNQRRRLELSTLGLTIMMIASPLTYSNFGFNVFFPIIVCIACLLFLRFIFPMLLDEEKVEEEKIEKGSKYIQVFLFMLQFAIVLGSLTLL